MTLRRAFEGLFVVVAILVGTTASAFAHAGHSHTQHAAAIATSSDATITPTITYSSEPVVALIWSAGDPRADRALSLDASGKANTHPDGPPCTPGACGCQGASMCGMGGHCCASMMPDSMHWTRDSRDHMRFHLARLGWVYPDIYFGLDRPPKV